MAPSPAAELLTPWQALMMEGAGAADVSHLADDDMLPAELVADLHDPRLVLSPGYVGPDRRATGLWAGLRRATYRPRRALLRIELLIVALVALVSVVTVLAISSGGHASSTSAQPAASPRVGLAPVPLVTTKSRTAPAATVPASTTPVTSSTTPTASTPTTTPPTTTPTAAAPPAASTAAAAPVDTAALTPTQMGAQALALVTYPWQKIPGYTIQFLPITDAPSPGFYGNTTFTWGQAGGTSVLYVYPGETVERLAAITAFEIGHEVDAAAVEPQGGEAQIENILGIHPASWAPNCDCAEQNYLSGWYAAAFSNRWSPGVGNWSNVAPSPTGATLVAVEPWLDPTLP